jgi:hypothetical protein
MERNPESMHPRQMKDIPYSILLILVLSTSLFLANGERAKTFADETEQKAFKALKEKMMDPKTGLPKTLDPSLIKGKDREGYQIAKEIPEILARVPCFCGCEAVGHESLLDCFVDDHAVG